MGILNSDWFRVGGGDGFYTQQDPTDWAVVYSESQDGAVNRLDLRKGTTTSIRPRAPRAAGQGGPSPEQLAQMAAQFGMQAPSTASNIVPEPPAGEALRFFWNTPTVLSPHNPSTVWVGGNRLFKSVNRGDTFTMTPDLTRNLSRFTRPIMGVAGDAPMASKHDGVATTSVITTVAESPVVPGVVWVGTNDGNLQISRDGGATWKNVVENVKGVPDETFVARVEPSHFDAGACYVAFDGHRTDDHKPYVFVTKDFGETWAPVSGDLPAGNVNVVREDPKNRNLLYAGTEYAMFISLDGGKQWKPFMTGLPTVRIDDILVHPRDNDLIIGTHGRSIWIIDDISALQQMTDQAVAADVTLFPPRSGGGVAERHHAEHHRRRQQALPRRQPDAWHGHQLLPEERAGRGRQAHHHGRHGPRGPRDRRNEGRRAEPRPVEPARRSRSRRRRRSWCGWRRQAGGGGGRGGFGGPAVEPGTYLLKLTVGGKDYTQKIVVEADTY